MSDAMYGFATGFAQGFNSTYTARMQNEAAEKRDKIRFGAQAWLKQEERYNAAKASDEQMMQQAEALVESQSLIPTDATIDIYNMLRGGMTSSQIISDVRTSGSKFESLPKPSESGLVVEDSTVSTELGDQTEAMLEDDNQGLSPGANSPGVTVPNANEVAGENTATAIVPKEEKDDPNNPFSQYNTQIREAVNQTEGTYFDDVLGGYKAPARANKYNFIPGITKADKVTVNQLIADTVVNTDAYKNGTPEERLKLLYNAASPSKQDETMVEQFRSKLGTGAEAASMLVWSFTEEGIKALQKGDPTQISTAWAGFHDVVDPDKDSAWDPDDIEGSIYKSWTKTPEGIKATTADGSGNVDSAAIAAAMATATDVATQIREATNGRFGFNIADVKTLDDVANARVQYEGNESINAQLDKLNENLLSAQREKTVATDKGKDYSVYGISPEGGLSYIGVGTRRMGKLYMTDPETGKEEEVAPQDANRMGLAGLDVEFDAEKVNASGWVKKQSALTGSVAFARSSLSYIAKLEKTPTARTYVARGAARVSEFMNEIDALGALVQDKDGLISREKLEEQIKTNVSFKKYGDEVNAIIAQEALLVFQLAKAEGNSGHALSNQDYTNYFNGLFRGNSLELTRGLLEEKAGNAFTNAIKSAKELKDAPGMRFITGNGNGSSWWQDPRATALEGEPQALVNFLDAGQRRVSDLMEDSSYGATPKQKRDAYIAGEEILIDEAFVAENPAFKSFLGQRIQSKLEDRK